MSSGETTFFHIIGDTQGQCALQRIKLVFGLFKGARRGPRFVFCGLIPKNQVLREGRGFHPAAYFQARGGAERAAIEDERIVGADRVDVDDGNTAARDQPGGEAKPFIMLTGIIGRRRRHNDKVGAQVKELPYGVILIAGLGSGFAPKILANGDPDAAVSYGEDFTFVSRLEIPSLVKDIIGGQ